MHVTSDVVIGLGNENRFFRRLMPVDSPLDASMASRVTNCLRLLDLGNVVALIAQIPKLKTRVRILSPAPPLRRCVHLQNGGLGILQYLPQTGLFHVQLLQHRVLLNIWSTNPDHGAA